MLDLQAQLQSLDLSSTLWIGVGTSHYADDAAGLVLAQLLIDSHIPHVVLAGANPERWISAADRFPFREVVFLDAVELGVNPGSVVFLGAEEMIARFPQVTTHKLSLGLLARCVESQGQTRAWLLGIQPHSLQPELDAVLGLSPSWPSWFQAPNPASALTRSLLDDRTATLEPPTGLSPCVRLTVELLDQLIVQCVQSQLCPATEPR
jgi:hydrogenase maturation protease